eukprot:gene29-40_t
MNRPKQYIPNKSAFIFTTTHKSHLYLLPLMRLFIGILCVGCACFKEQAEDMPLIEQPSFEPSKRAVQCHITYLQIQEADIEVSFTNAATSKKYKAHFLMTTSFGKVSKKFDIPLDDEPNQVILKVDMWYNKKLKKSFTIVIPEIPSEQLQHLEQAIKKRDPKMIEVLAAKAKPTDIENALRIAVEKGDQHIIELLLPHVQEASHFLLRNALEKGDSTIIDLLLDKADPANIHCELMQTTKDRDPQIVKLLINKTQPEDISLKLTCAAKQGDIALINLLIPKAADTDLALDLAARNGQQEIVPLLAGKATPNGITKTLYQLTQNWNPTIIKQLLPHTQKIDWEVIKKAISMRDATIVELSVDKADREDIHTALSLATGNGDVTIVNLLSRKATNVDNALSIAVENGYQEIFDLLIDKATANGCDYALTLAIDKGDIEIIKRIIPHMQNVNSQIVNRALEKRDPAIIKLLMERITSREIGHMLTKAAEKGDATIANLLIEKATPDVTDRALYDAVDKQDQAIVTLLMEKATPRGIDRALNRATKKGEQAIVTLLMEKATPGGINFALNMATLKGNQAIITLLVEKATPDGINFALFTAVDKQDQAIINLLHPKATDTSAALCTTKDLHMIQVLLDKAQPKSIKAALKAAIYDGEADIVTVLLPKVAGLDEAFMTAVKEDNTSMVALILPYVPKVEYALSLAAKQGNEAMVHLLIEKADQEWIDEAYRIAHKKNYHSIAAFLFGKLNNLGYTLSNAVSSNNQGIINDLLKKCSQEDLNVALNQAAKTGYWWDVEALLNYGAKDVDTALKSAAAEDTMQEMVSYLVDKATPKGKDEALKEVAIQGNQSRVEFLLSHGATAVAPACIAAAKNGHQHIVRYLLDKVTPQGKNEALEEGAIKGNQDRVEFPLSHEAKAVDPACIAAAENGHQPIVAYLSDRVTQSGRDMALRKAAENGHLHTAVYLLDIKAKNDDVRQILWHAASNNHLPIVTHFSNLATSSDIQEAFIAAAMNGHLKIIMHLIEQIKQPHLGMALSGAASKGHKNLVKWFLENHNNQLAKKYKLVEQDIQDTFKDKLLTEQDMQEALRAADINQHTDIITLLQYHDLDHID